MEMNQTVLGNLLAKVLAFLDPALPGIFAHIILMSHPSFDPFKILKHFQGLRFTGAWSRPACFELSGPSVSLRLCFCQERPGKASYGQWGSQIRQGLESKHNRLPCTTLTCPEERAAKPPSRKAADMWKTVCFLAAFI